MGTKLSISKKFQKIAILVYIKVEISLRLYKLIKTNVRSNKVKITGFGTFYLHKTAIRNGRNPKTRESYIIPSMVKLAFKASNKAKRKLNY